ncbi:hypothetical protein WA026_009455 [Henosepilachna vigintioctopunctata]|uniref:YLP motif-containing protein 1 n=1 Tax=Henosepilachna vigintioctopunctata TaxID=420089 RepID=A0AAW1U4R9_9CUCU
MSWTQWPVGQPPPSVAAAPPLINPAPAVVPPALPYAATDQWSQMQQQNWQQWAQWQQQYQQWHQQYGAEYQKSMSALAAQQPVVHNLGVPPPLPIEPQPPLPLEELPKPAPPLPAVSGAPPQPVPLQPPVSQYTTHPPPSNNFSAPPPNFATNQQNWRPSDNPSLDQKRPLVSGDESAAKRQMVNRQVWKGPTNALAQTTQNWQNSSNLEELSEAEKKFDKQFAEWEAQFNKWKDQNSGHPDKQQYKEYEKKWEQWRQQLLDRREAMRKKRLGLTAANKATPNQNFSIPPPPQGQTAANIPTLPITSQSVLAQKPPPTLPVQPKEPLLPTPDAFSKPPPNMNDEPLQFKKPEGDEEHQAETLGFLNTSKSDGIPGLDLVKDDEPEEENTDKITQKGPDLEAISKGINNILGDQKLMSMLSMVSQTQNVSQNSNINTMSKISDHLPGADQSNLSMEQSPNERFVHSEVVQNFDDQTRSSFTMQPNDAEFYRGMPPGNQLNKGGFQMNLDVEPPYNRGPIPNDRFENRQWSGPGEDDFRRPPPNRFARGFDNNLVPDQSRGPMMNKNSGNFDGHPTGMHMDDFNSRNSDRRNNFGLSGQECDMNRESFANARMERDISGTGNMSRGLLNREPSSMSGMSRDPSYPGSLNRGYGQEGVNRGGFGQKGMIRDSFGPGGFNQDSLGPGGIIRNNLESAAMNRDSFGTSGMNRGAPGSGGLMRDSLGSGMMMESGVPGLINRDSFGPSSMNRNELAPTGPGNMMGERFGSGNRDNFGPSGVAHNMNRLAGLGGPSKERLELVERGNMNRDKFESHISSQGGRSHFERPNMAMDRDDFASRPPDGKFGNRVGPNPNVRKNSRSDNFDYSDDAPHFSTSFDDNNFRHGRGLGDDRRGDRVDPLENFNHRRNERMSIDSRKDRFAQDTTPFNRSDVRNDEYEPRGFGLAFHEDEDRGNFEDRNELYPNRKGDRFLSRSFGNDREPNFRDNYRGNFRDEEENYPPPPPIYGQQASSDKGPVQNRNSIVNSLLDAPEPPHLQRGAFDEDFMMEEQYSRDAHGNDFPDHIAPVEPPIDDLWKPMTVIDYDHKSLNEPEMDILVEPFRMFDYRHKPLDRIPFSERPNWLSDTVRMIPEFDPPLIRAPTKERRVIIRSEERYEPLRIDERYDPVRMDDRYNPSRSDNRYDVSRMDDRYDPYRYERRSYSRFSPPPPRREYEDSNWSSARRNRSRSPTRFEKPPPDGDRGERNRSRDRGRDWETEGRNKRGESRDLEERKLSSKDWSDKDVRRERDDYRDRGDREEFRERDQYKDRDSRDDNKDRGDRDGFKNRGSRDDYKSRSDRGEYIGRDDGDEYRNRMERDDYRDRGRDWKPTSNKEGNLKNKEWEERERQWEVDSVDMDDREGSRERDIRYKNDRNVDGDTVNNDFNRRSGGEIFPLSRSMESKKSSNITMIEDLINPPGRSNRPPRIVIILRGPPGSGKTYLAKLIKDKEVENGGSAPRILSLDDYFMVEQEKEIIEDGRRVKTKDMVYEFEAEMEEAYRASLMRSFKKTVTDGYFSFIIVDNVNDKVKHFGEMWSFAKQNGFQVYISQLDLDVQNCTKRNVHNRSEDDIRKCVEGWEDTPSHHPVLDVTYLTQGEPISEVEMEEINSPGSDAVDDGLERDLMASINPSAPPELWKNTFNATTSGSLPNPQSQGRRGYDGPIWRNANNRRR